MNRPGIEAQEFHAAQVEHRSLADNYKAKQHFLTVGAPGNHAGTLQI
jgi:hypothetical protein